jgi:hypothetical protein
MVGLTMRRYLGNMKGEKFLGNKSTMEIHDLDNEKSLCKISEIIIARYDIPFNSLYDANKKRFDNCSYCIGNLSQ